LEGVEGGRGGGRGSEETVLESAIGAFPAVLAAVIEVLSAWKVSAEDAVISLRSL
jgi:hypothetical protein